MDLRWGRGDINRMQALAQELVSLRPDIILTSTTMSTLAVQRERRTIPLVFVTACVSSWIRRHIMRGREIEPPMEPVFKRPSEQLCTDAFLP